MTQPAHPAVPVPTPDDPVSPSEARRSRTGLILLTIGCLLLVGMGLTPAPYVLRQPGPVFNAIGRVAPEEGAEPVPVITVSGAQSFEPESGSFEVMTVNIVGNPSSQPNWFEVLSAYLTPSRDALPIEAYYPSGGSTEQRDEENRQLMRSSQEDAIAAALVNRGYQVPKRLTISEVVADGAANGILQAGDVLLSANGEPLADGQVLTDFLQRNGEQEMTLQIVREGAASEVRIAPRIMDVNGVPTPRLGVIVGMQYEFPVEVSIELGNVGGPSAGLIFSLSIIDKLTPGDLAQGREIAGTGTIDVNGSVGPIGGIRQKLYAAEQIGAQAFLLPVANCAEALAGGVPGNLPLYAVDSLSGALDAVTHVTTDGAEGSRVSCEQVSG